MSANIIPRVIKTKVIRQTIVRLDHYPIQLSIQMEDLVVRKGTDLPKEKPRINSLKNLPIATRKDNVREAMKDLDPNSSDIVFSWSLPSTIHSEIN